MLADLDPRRRMPDILAEYLELEPQTDEEAAAGLVIAMHRRWLNGAFETAMSNLSAADISAEACVEAYARLGLIEAAECVDQAIDAGRGEGWDLLDRRYEALTYGGVPEIDDQIDHAVIRFAQRNLSAFEGAASALR